MNCRPATPIITRAWATVFKTHYLLYLASTSILSDHFATIEPRGFKSSVKHLEWLAIMQEEIDALQSNHTWDLVPRPSVTNIVDLKWVFRMKFHADGSIKRRRAYLVAKGVTHTLGTYFHHNFSTIIKVAIVRIILSLVAHFISFISPMSKMPP